ncbi:MAG: MBL fold metallo-hydrolase [bacterium]|nr:MBL fold metallo-hydrolase [bacterium]
MITTKINQRVERFNDQYFYGESVGVYLINLDDKTVLFDLPNYSIEAEKYLAEKQKPVFAILSHGACGIKDGKTWQKKLGMQVCLHKKDADHEWLMMKPDILFTTTPHLDDDIVVIHTPGHSPGSVCLLEKSTNTLFTGDTFGGTPTGKVRDFRVGNHRYDDIPKRIQSCNGLLKYNFESVMPFHYEMILNDGRKTLQAFVEKTNK